MPHLTASERTAAKRVIVRLVTFLRCISLSPRGKLPRLRAGYWQVLAWKLTGTAGIALIVDY